MRFSSLDQWLRWQESLHPKSIDLGLERPRKVLERMGTGRPAPVVITVGGTNGKGSTVALLESILHAAGYHVGAYTSPHLLHYVERIRLDKQTVSEELLCEAFERVDGARGDESLTYFEFGTLAAFDLFRRASLDVAVLEVGLGGRLDAVNLIDPDVAIITTIDIDHAEWLGTDRDSVAREKAGIFRQGRPAVCSDPVPPDSLVEAAGTLGTPLYRISSEFGYERNGEQWRWWGPGQGRESLPLPALRGVSQLRNASGVLMALALLADRLPISQQQLREGLLQVQLPGRFQLLPGPVTEILDVAHNPESARELAANLRSLPSGGKTHAVFAMLADKDIGAVISEVRGQVDIWHIADLPDVVRNASVDRLGKELDQLGVEQVFRYRSVAEARRGAFERSRPGDRVVVFGSFHTVAQAMAEQV